MPSKTKNRPPKKGTAKKNPLQSFTNKPKSVYVKVVIVAILVAILVWLAFFRPDQRYSVNTAEVRNRIQKTLDTAQLQGKQLATNVVDKGCSSGSSVGLSTRIECSMEGYKYFEVTNDKKEALSIASTNLMSSGYSKEAYNNYSSEILDGTREGDIYYSKNRTTASLSWAKWPTDVNGSGSIVLNQAVSVHDIDTPSNGTTVVGVKSKEVYFSCTSKGLDLLGISCILPPHPVNK